MESHPLTAAPIIKYKGFLTPLNINAIRTPGNILCATVSTMSVFLRRKLNVPTAPLTPPKSKIAKATYRTLGSERVRYLMRSFKDYFK